MTAVILDGKTLAKKIQEEIADEVAEFFQENSITPCLAAVLVGEDPASEVYVRSKRKACERTGLDSQLHRLPRDATEDDLLDLIKELNLEDNVHGILVQLPLPGHIDESRILQAIHPLKDVDAFHPENVGRIVQGRPRYLPCTPHGVQQILLRNNIEIEGRHVVIVGRSDIVGKPLAIMLMQRAPGANATVTVCHSRTQNLAEITRTADILVVAIGSPGFIKADMVKPGAVVVDVGINRLPDGKLVGDVDFDAVREVASHITPVPGGVGRLTVTMVIQNTFEAARQQLA